MNAQTDLRNTVKRNLVADVARSFGKVHLKVAGTSMLPSLWPGDILKVCPVNIADVPAGDVVVFSRNSFLVTHRVICNSGSTLITRGDSLTSADPPVSGEELLGRVVSIHRAGRRVDPSPAWWHGVGCWILRRSQLSARVLLGLRRHLCPNSQ